MAGSTADTILAIYDAALSDEHWPRALGTMSAEIAAVGAFLVAVDQVGLPFRIEQSSYPLELLKDYFEHYGHFDQEYFASSATTPPLKLLRDCDVRPDVQSLEERPDYKWMKEHIGARRKAGVRLTDGNGWTDVLALQFAGEWAPSSQAVQAQLDVFLPHLAKVVELNRKFSILRHQYQAVLSVLDRVRIGTCIIGSNGHVVVQNKEAQRIFSLDDGLSLSKAGSMVGSTSDISAKISEMVSAMSLTARGQGSEHEAAILVQRESGGRPLLVEFAPLRDSSGEIQRGFSGAVVFIVDPENTGAIALDRLCHLFRLTKCEAEVAARMTGGLSAQEIANERGVSEGTIKSQFKAIYAKTGVHKRTELLRLAIAVDPPIERPA